MGIVYGFCVSVGASSTNKWKPYPFMIYLQAYLACVVFIIPYINIDSRIIMNDNVVIQVAGIFDLAYYPNNVVRGWGHTFIESNHFLWTMKHNWSAWCQYNVTGWLSMWAYDMLSQ